MADVRDNPARPGGGPDKHDPRGVRAPRPARPANAPATGRDEATPKSHSSPPAARRSRLANLWHPSEPYGDAPRLWLTRADQAFVALLLGAAVLLMTLHWLN